MSRENSADLTEQAITGATPAEIKELLAAHNKYRQKHHAPALTWDTTLADRAQKWSNNCEFKHSGTPGENLGYGYPTSTALVDAWYDEVANYNYSKPGFSLKTGHFTQVVWKGTTKVGCGVQTCNNFFRGAKFYTCNYSPYGNVIGANNKYFIENVLKP